MAHDDDDPCWLPARENRPLAPPPETRPPNDGCQRADFDTQFPEFDTSHPMPHLARVRRGGGPVTHAVRSDIRIVTKLKDGVAGITYVGTDPQRYGRQEVIAAITAVGASWEDLRQADLKAQAQERSVIPRPLLQIVDIGNIGGGPLRKNNPPPNGNPFHASHDLGVDVDDSVVRNDGKKGRSKYSENTYSRELTREAIRLFLDQKVLLVSIIFFDDPEIDLPTQFVRPDRNSHHSDHFHVRFKHPPGMFP
jgi:hypothetical protein